MGILGWGEENKDQLKEKIVELNNQITTLRDEKIEAQISESRINSGFNAQKEADRANHQMATAQLQRRIQELEADYNDAVIAFQNSCELQNDKKMAEYRASVRKELRAEFGTEFDSLKKSVASLTTENSKHKGLYDGALLVIKALETQVTSLTKANSTLTEGIVKALPTVSAEITTPNPSVVVGSGNKS